MTQVTPDTTATPLRPLDRQAIKPAPSVNAARLQSLKSLPAAQGHEQVSRLAQDAFISRSYELNNGAVMGQGLDGALRNMSAVASDIEGLRHPDLTLGTGIALSGKLVRDLAGTAVSGGRVLEGARMAHLGIARVTGGYQSTVKVVDRTLRSASTHLRPLFGQIERIGAVGSLGMATIAMPALAVSAVKRNTAAVRTLTSDTATARQKVEAVKAAAYTNAGLAYTAMAVPTAIKTLATTGAAKSTVSRLARATQKTGAYRAADGARGVIAPIADATLLVADGLHLYTTMTSPSATGTAKARAALNVGLDALKLGLYACPQTRGVQLAYTAAGLAQFGFAVHAVIRPAKP
jgi:hypothetical protein